MIEQYTFVHPWWFGLFAVLVGCALWEWRYSARRRVAIALPTLSSIARIGGWRSRLQPIVPALRYAGLAFLVVAMARPQKTLTEEIVRAEGIDIFLVMDLSSSMLARDFNPDRLEASKRVASEFVVNRPYDRIGLAVFAGESYTQCPLTSDHRVVVNFLSSLQCGVLKDGTAIGMGLAAAVNRLKDSEAETKVIILLTDGVNNAGYIRPLIAADVAKEFGVRVYTIGIGTRGDALAPMSRRDDGRYMFGMARVEIDEELLMQISEMTGGKYYRATSEEGLEQIYAEIDQLEKTEMEVTAFKRYSEEYVNWLLAGIALLVMSLFTSWTVLRTAPVS